MRRSDQYDNDSMSENNSRNRRNSSQRHLEENKEERELVIAQAETKAVVSMRMLLLALLVSSTIGVALAVYFITYNTEKNRFHELFQSDAEKVFESMGASLDNSLAAADAFVVSMVVAARHLNNSSWPFFTMPSFAVTALKLRSLSNAFVVSYYPVVLSDQREAWQNYSIANDEWVNEAIDVQSRDESFHVNAPTTEEWQGWGEIFTSDGPIQEEGPYLPTWTTAPVVRIEHSPYNWGKTAL